MRAKTTPCPICKKPAEPRPTNPSHPFCSPRCKQIDLGQWLEERYRLPAEDEAPEEAPESDKKPS